MKTYGIDANALLRPNPTGVEKYVQSLLSEMMKQPLLQDERVFLYAAQEKPTELALPPGWEWKCLPFFLPKGWTHLRLSWELFLHAPDVFFSPAHEIPLFPGRAKVVSTVHDVAFRKDAALYGAAAMRRQEWAISRVKKYARRIITISESTKRDLKDLFSFDLSRVTVTHLAPSFSVKPTDEFIEGVLRSYRLSKGQYFSYLGRIEEKKNISTLIKAFLIVKERLGHGHPLQLVLMGSDGYGAREIKELAAPSSFASDIRFLGYVPDVATPSLLGGSLAFVFPSHEEGFGLPLLEGMVAGVPVISSDIPVFREIGGDAVKFVSTTHVEGFVNAMQEMIFDEGARNELIRKGNAQVGKFTWKKTAEETWTVLRSL